MPSAPSPKRPRKYLRGLLWLSPLCALLLAPILTGQMPTNVARTNELDPDPRMRPLPAEWAFDDARLSLRTLIPTLRTYGRSWRLISEEMDEEADQATFRIEVPVVVFTDDLVVTVHRVAQGTRIEAVSRSRVGKGDFGENRRHIIQLLDALRERFD
jgi:uncharacterized protein (DUF1499 family)